MKAGKRTSRAVIACDPNLCVLELARHWLSLDRVIQLQPLQAHIYGTAVTDRTLERSLHESVVTRTMHIMAALDRYDHCRGSEHPLAADGAIALCGSLDTSMRGGICNINAHIASLETCVSVPVAVVVGDGQTLQ